MIVTAFIDFLNKLGMGSNNSTPQRKDSFSDYGKAQHPYQHSLSQVYSSLGVSPGAASGMGGMSSPGPLSSLVAHGHHNINSPPPSMSPSNLMLGKLYEKFCLLYSVNKHVVIVA